jgi:hypothetical protein
MADPDHVVRGALGFVRLGTCALVVAWFAMFAIDQANGASKHQVAELSAGTATGAATPTVTARHPSQPRRFIDGAATVLTAPFRAVFHTGSQWAQRGFATACALLLYGLGLGYLLRYSAGTT